MNEKMYLCSRCGGWVEEKKVCIVDATCICVKCMYAGSEPFEIYPIGVVRNNLRRSPHDFGVLGTENVSRIELLPTQSDFMYKLEEEKNITVVYYLHQARPVRSLFKRGLDGKEVGVFASRTPDRLSKIGIQDVRLIKIEKTTLHVKGLDAVDGSPVLDIKLVLPGKKR